MELIFISLMFLGVVLFIKFYAFVLLNSVKIMTFVPDMILIVFYTIYFLHGMVSVKISSGNIVYIWDVVFAILAVVNYMFLLVFIHKKLSIVSNILNYIVAYIGISIVVPFLTDLISAFVNSIYPNIKHTTHIMLLNNPIADQVLYQAIYLLLAIWVYRIRMKKLNSNL